MARVTSAQAHNTEEQETEREAPRQGRNKLKTRKKHKQEGKRVISTQERPPTGSHSSFQGPELNSRVRIGHLCLQSPSFNGQGLHLAAKPSVSRLIPRVRRAGLLCLGPFQAFKELWFNSITGG